MQKDSSISLPHQTRGTHPSRADHSRQMPWKWLGTALDQAGHPTPHHTVNAPILGCGQKHEMVATGMRNREGGTGEGGFQRESHTNPTLSLLHTGYITHITSLPRHARVHAHACMCLSNTRTHTHLPSIISQVTEKESKTGKASVSRHEAQGQNP